MRPILTLRQYTHDLIVHSHDHAQLVFGLSGALDFEVEGCGSQVRQQSFVVIPADACSTTPGACPWTPGKANWSVGWRTVRWMIR